jgi:hypothetical protein
MRTECDAAIEGVHEHCCLHDLPFNVRRRMERKFETGDIGQVCCWCGLLYSGRHDEYGSHGPYQPGLSTTAKQKRTARLRRELREQGDV